MKLTVLMSVYNDEEYLVESIESILNQTYKDFRFLIYDDASTDNTTNILKKYSKIDPRIKLIINQKNKGLSYNLAQGVLESKTEFIARMDADDIALPNRFEKQIRYMEDKDVDIVGSYAEIIDQDGSVLRTRRMPIDDKRIKRLMWACPIIHPSVIYRRKIILKSGSYNPKLRRRQDYDLWFRCMANDAVFYNIPEVLIKYRENEKEFYKKNNLAVQFDQFKIGLKGSIQNKLIPIGIIGVLFNFVINIMPSRLKFILRKVTRYLDPREI